MMFAIGMSILAVFFREGGEGGKRINPRYATGLMLITTFAASIGGLATPIGTPPNLIGIKQLRDQFGVDFSFFQWSLIGFPIVGRFVFVHVRLSEFLLPCRRERNSRRREPFFTSGADRSARGPTSQKSTMFAFGLTVSLWIFPGIVGLVVRHRQRAVPGLEESAERRGRGDSRRRAVVLASRRSRRSGHQLEGGRKDRLGYCPALRRRLRTRLAGREDGPRESDRRRALRPAADLQRVRDARASPRRSP